MPLSPLLSSLSFFPDFIFHLLHIHRFFSLFFFFLLGSPLFFLHNSVFFPPSHCFPSFFHPLFLSVIRAFLFFFLPTFLFLIFNSVSLRPCSQRGSSFVSPPLCSCSCLALRAFVQLTPRLSSTAVLASVALATATHARVSLARVSHLRVVPPDFLSSSPRRPLFYGRSSFFFLVLFSFSSPSSTAISFLRSTPLSFPNQSPHTYVKYRRLTGIPGIHRFFFCSRINVISIFPFRLWIDTLKRKRKEKRERERECFNDRMPAQLRKFG